MQNHSYKGYEKMDKLINLLILRIIFNEQIFDETLGVYDILIKLVDKIFS